MKTTGILISNLGTPDAPTKKAVRHYLREFLSDPEVVDKPRWLWLLVLYGIILNVRPARSAKKYAKIWTAAGSPLLVYSQKITQKLQAAMPKYKVSLGMRYGNPSLQAALTELAQAGMHEIILLPLYPQYSFSTNRSTIELVKDLLKNTPLSLKVVASYYQDSRYIHALASQIQDFWRTHGRAQKLVFSFHGLPQSMINKGDPYLSQCQTTTKLLAQKLNLAESEYQMTFQSRVGVEKWLQPYTMEVMQKLPKQNIEHIQVFCPGFACDCLETLEEINIENRNFFLSAGGKKYEYIPCLNDQEAHIDLLKGLLEDLG